MTTPTELDIERISTILARFSRYTDQFEQEKTTYGRQKREKAQKMGTVSKDVGDTSTTHRRTNRTVSATVNREANKEESSIFRETDSGRHERPDSTRMG